MTDVRAYGYEGYYEYMPGRKEDACADLKKGKEMGDSVATRLMKSICK
jgi:hypothetical protein